MSKMELSEANGNYQTVCKKQSNWVEKKSAHFENVAV